MTRERLLEILKDSYGCTICAGSNYGIDEAIAWLERQPDGTRLVTTDTMNSVVYDDDCPGHTQYFMPTTWMRP